MASNPVGPGAPVSSTDKLKQIFSTLTEATLFIEQILTAIGAGGATASEIERLTAAFSNLAAIAIQAAHDVAGREISTSSVLALLPVGTTLVAPADSQPIASAAQ